MTQLTDKIREAIIGNIGTVISGRIGVTDAELLQKKFAPTFDAEDLTKLPNFQTVASVMINNVPSAPFSMSLVPPMGQSNPQLRDALKKLSAAKYGRPRAQVEQEIFARLGAGDAAKKAKLEALKQAQQQRMRAASGSGAPSASPASPGSSFLDEWLAKRQQIGGSAPTGRPVTPPLPSAPVSATPSSPMTASPAAPVQAPGTMADRMNDELRRAGGQPLKNPTDTSTPITSQPPQQPTRDSLHLRGDKAHHADDEISIRFR
jgi:hypothetical protein